jgi:hypothetical protein
MWTDNKIGVSGTEFTETMFRRIKLKIEEIR